MAKSDWDGPITGNRGEWSELYAIFRLLHDGELRGANADLSADPKMRLKVLKLSRLVEGKEFGGKPAGPDGRVALWYNGHVFHDRATLERQATQLLNAILRAPASGGTFSIEETEAFLDKIGCRAIKASSHTKRDIDITVEDNHTGGTPTYGFSIKSELGAAPTLLNASDATQFVYRVPRMDPTLIPALNAIEGKKRYTLRVKELQTRDLMPRPIGARDETFLRNLQMLDDALPDIMARLLLLARLYGCTRLADACARLAEENPRGYSDPSLYGVKVRRFLRAAALGMVPSKPWKDVDDATGGYLIVKENGELVAFYVYNRAKFDDYLFASTCFETPSGDRYHPLEFREVNGEVRFDLCMQIRFR